MQSYNKSTKSKTVPVFILICGCAIIGSAIIGSKSSFSANVQEEQTQTRKELIEVNKEESNRRLSDLQVAISYALEGERVDSITQGVGNILKQDSEKVKFAFYTAVERGNNSKIKRNTTPEGYSVTGYNGVDKEYFIDLYQDLFNAGLNEDLLSVLFTEKDGYIYGSTMTILLMSHEVYKVNSVYKDGDNLEIIIDVLEVDDSNTDVDYRKDSVVEYPKEAVSYQITLNVTEVNEVYRINSMVA